MTRDSRSKPVGARLRSRLDAEGTRAALGEALHGLSARLLLAGALEDDATHAAYEKVVERFSALTALTQAPRSCCAEERERCAKIADAAIKTAAIADPQSVASPGDCAAVACNAIRSNSHDG